MGHVVLLQWTQVANIRRVVITSGRQPLAQRHILVGMLIVTRWRLVSPILHLVLLGNGLLLERPLKHHVFARLTKINGGWFVEGRQIVAALAETGHGEIVHLAYFRQLEKSVICGSRSALIIGILLRRALIQLGILVEQVCVLVVQ